MYKTEETTKIVDNTKVGDQRSEVRRTSALQPLPSRTYKTDEIAKMTDTKNQESEIRGQIKPNSTTEEWVDGLASSGTGETLDEKNEIQSPTSALQPLISRTYKTGEIAKMSGVSIRTIRYYDSKGLLTPSAYSSSGHRLYTDEDFSKLKRILALKYLGLSLEEVLNIENSGFEKGNILKSLQVQKQILRNKIHHMKLALNSIEEAESKMVGEGDLDWSEVVDIVKIIESENVLRQKFIDSSNLSAEIKLINQLDSDKNWYEWVFKRLDFECGEHVLELGCGEGALWYKNESLPPQSLNVTLTEVTSDLLSCAKQNLRCKFPHFKYEVTQLESLAFTDESFDVVIANHVLFFSKRVDLVLSEVNRILKKGGRFYCSTITKEHMKEIETLLKNYNKSINLGKSDKLKNFGFEKAKSLLEAQFVQIKSEYYDDELTINCPDELLNYIYSIPGQMLTIASNKKKEFETYIYKQMVDTQSNFKISNSHVLFSSRRED